jgi:hypothetical protein
MLDGRKPTRPSFTWRAFYVGGYLVAPDVKSMPKTAQIPPLKLTKTPINKGFYEVANCVRNAVDAHLVSLSWTCG